MELSRGQSAIHQIIINWTCRTRSVFNSPITYLSEMKQKNVVNIPGIFLICFLENMFHIMSLFYVIQTHAYKLDMNIFPFFTRLYFGSRVCLVSTYSEFINHTIEK